MSYSKVSKFKFQNTEIRTRIYHALDMLEHQVSIRDCLEALFPKSDHLATKARILYQSFIPNTIHSRFTMGKGKVTFLSLKYLGMVLNKLPPNDHSRELMQALKLHTSPITATHETAMDVDPGEVPAADDDLPEAGASAISHPITSDSVETEELVQVEKDSTNPPLHPDTIESQEQTTTVATTTTQDIQIQWTNAKTMETRVDSFTRVEQGDLSNTLFQSTQQTIARFGGGCLYVTLIGYLRGNPVIKFGQTDNFDRRYQEHISGIGPNKTIGVLHTLHPRRVEKFFADRFFAGHRITATIPGSSGRLKTQTELFLIHLDLYDPERIMAFMQDCVDAVDREFTSDSDKVKIARLKHQEAMVKMELEKFRLELLANLIKDGKDVTPLLRMTGGTAVPSETPSASGPDAVGSV
ncbi:uncharacterized protein BJ171DRAFT_594014 [Polychytrium aggregatum]|uniref:uncharacterized protein n=1 Tax=Polychytrium aggregatum TaxID=110093 RepID=UPI0022FEC1A6|nr:uncharacterized protein BJ171DRAFT_594014 [Polychytrium aggregatum]KAI9183757.1 hypothetical protein BJ171DRAFT_594014 [Polychytrium aggregatum]